MAGNTPTLAMLRQQRELAITRLCRHFALDHLEAEELEQRIDRAHQAATAAELEALFEGLPPLEQATAPLPVPRRGTPDDFQIVLALMGGTQRKGSWTPPRSLYVTAVMGGAVLDFREAHLATGVTEVYVLALMGGVEIIVPPGVHLESHGVGIMGGFEHAGRGRFPVDASVPVIRVTGAAIMGGVEVRVREPGEPAGSLSGHEQHRLQRGEPRDGSGWTGPGRR